MNEIRETQDGTCVVVDVDLVLSPANGCVFLCDGNELEYPSDRVIRMSTSLPLSFAVSSPHVCVLIIPLPSRLFHLRLKAPARLFPCF